MSNKLSDDFSDDVDVLRCDFGSEFLTGKMELFEAVPFLLHGPPLAPLVLILAPVLLHLMLLLKLSRHAIVALVLLVLLGSRVVLPH